MKRTITIFFFLFFVLLYFVHAETFTFETGQVRDVSGYSVKLKNLKSDKAVVSVGNESAIFIIGEKKVISDVAITLVGITYIGKGEGSATLDVRVLYLCGDKICDKGESKITCCKDCGCQPGFDCIDNQCLAHVDDECASDKDCDDSDEKTLDLCTKGRPRKCSHFSSVICKQDIDCDDANPCTLDICTNNDCFNKKIENCVSGKEGETINVNIEENKTEKNLVVEPILKSEEEVSFIKKILNFFKKLFGGK